MCVIRIPLSLTNLIGLRLESKCGTCPPDTIVFEQFMWSTVEEHSMLIPTRSLGILFGSRLLRCTENEVLNVIMMMTMVVMVMMLMVMVMAMARNKLFPNSIYHNSRSTAPWRRSSSSSSSSSSNSSSSRSSSSSSSSSSSK